jgi:hypothetical protein
LFQPDLQSDQALEVGFGLIVGSGLRGNRLQSRRVLRLRGRKLFLEIPQPLAGGLRLFLRRLKALLERRGRLLQGLQFPPCLFQTLAYRFTHR